MKKKKASVAEMEQLVVELTGNWKRAMADYQNLEKRIESQQSNYIKMASVGLIDKLLPVLDDLERAEAHLKDSGISMISKQLRGVLESEGVSEIEAVDLEFDPTKMDCVEIVEGKKNMVTGVVQVGYQLDEIIIRPAKVEVGNGHTQEKNQK